MIVVNFFDYDIWLFLVLLNVVLVNCEFYVYLFYFKRLFIERVIWDIIIYVLWFIVGKIYVCLCNFCDRMKDRLGEREREGYLWRWKYNRGGGGILIVFLGIVGLFGNEIDYLKICLFMFSGNMILNIVLII